MAVSGPPTFDKKLAELVFCSTFGIDPQETLDPDLGTAAYPWKADGRILAC